MAQYSTQNDLSTELSISDILGDCEVTVRSSLQELKDQLLNLMKEIRLVGRKIAERSILRSNCITDVQDVIHRALNRQSLYSKQGKITKPKGAMVLQRAI